MKGSRVFALLCTILFLAACSDTPHIEPMTRHTIEYDGLEREFFVFLPSSYDGAASHPVAIFLHGYGGTATGTEAEVTQGLNFYAERAGYIVVYPQGTWFMANAGSPDQWEASSWNHISDGFDKGPAGPICTADAVKYPCPPECGDCGACGWTSCHNDVEFLKALVAEVQSTLVVDDVFVSGFSNGAMMAQRVACEASNLFAAAALIGARGEPGFECTPTEPMPLLQINGGYDTTAPPDGSLSHAGYFYSDTRSVIEHWSGGAQCAIESTQWTSSSISGKPVHCSLSCAGEKFESIDCLWPEGDHRWPGTPGKMGSNGYCVSELQSDSMPEQTICLVPERTTTIWGSSLMFEFFDSHRGG